MMRASRERLKGALPSTGLHHHIRARNDEKRRMHEIQAGETAPVSPTTMSRAEMFEDEKRRVIQSCFSRKEPDGSIYESYITHIRIVEDAAYPASPAPPGSPPNNKKPRLIIVSVKKSGRVRIHKARENGDGSFSIGKTWNMDELARIQTFEHLQATTPAEQNQKLWATNHGFVVTITKPYYWHAQTPKERDFFIGSLVKIYKKYTGGRVPDLVGFTQQDRDMMAGVQPVGQPRQQPAQARSQHSQQRLQQQQMQPQPHPQQPVIRQPLQPQPQAQAQVSPGMQPAQVAAQFASQHTSPTPHALPMGRPSREGLRKPSREQMASRGAMAPGSSPGALPTPSAASSQSRYQAYSPKNANFPVSTSPGTASPGIPGSPRTVGRPSTSGSAGAYASDGRAHRPDSRGQHGVAAPIPIPGANEPRSSLDIPSPTDRVRSANGTSVPSPLTRYAQQNSARSRSPSPAPPSMNDYDSSARRDSNASGRSKTSNAPSSQEPPSFAPSPSIQIPDRTASPAPSLSNLRTPTVETKRPSFSPSVRSGIVTPISPVPPANDDANMPGSALPSVSESAPPNVETAAAPPSPGKEPTANGRRGTIDGALESATGAAASVAAASAAAGAAAGAGAGPVEATEAASKTHDEVAPQAQSGEPLDAIKAAASIASGATAGEDQAEKASSADENFRPGLGPMVKPAVAGQKKDLASSIKKAANAYSAFKPRAGGAGERLLAAAIMEKEREKAGNGSPTSASNPSPTVPGEGDGITGVLRAPMLRTMSTDTNGTMHPPGSAQSPVSPMKEKAPPKLTPLATSDEALGKAPEKAVPEPATPAIEVSQHNEEKAEQQQAAEEALAAPKTQAERQRQKRQDELAELCGAIGVPPSLLESRGVEFDDILSSIGWNGRLADDKRIEDLEADIRREIGRVQAGSWLGHLELQQEGKVDQLAQLFDKTIAECDELEGLLTLYSHELNTLADDVAHIEAQSQGLQVQAANQKLLQNELQNLLQMISISPEELAPLQEAPMDNADGLNLTENALITLYKAMVTIDPEIRSNKKRIADTSTVGGPLAVYADAEIGQMHAVREKKREYRNEAHKFLLRLKTCMDMTFRMASKKATEARNRGPARTSMEFTTMNSVAHDAARQNLWPFTALMLFAREVNTQEWIATIRLYQEQMRPLYQHEVSENMTMWKRGVRKPAPEESEQLSFSHQHQEKEPSSAVEREGSVMGITEGFTGITEGLTTAARRLTVRRPKSMRPGHLHSKPSLQRMEGSIEAFEAFSGVLDDTSKAVSEEQNFLVKFFHLSSLSTLDFPDLVSTMPPEKRRIPDLWTSQSYDPDRDMAQRVERVMEDIFAPWATELQSLADWAAKIDPIQTVGLLLCLEKKIQPFEDSNQEFILHSLQKIHDHYKTLFHRFIEEQIRAIEETKVKVSKRKGVISFMRTFPYFSAAVENILSVSQETHDVRFLVNDAYSRINKAMWDTLKFIAKEAPGQASAGPGVQTTADFEEKEILNYHILLIENMNHFLEEVDPRENVVLMEWRRRANHDMLEHLRLYTDAVVRRPIGKLLDFIESTESLLQTVQQPTEIAQRPSHSRHMAKKVMFYLDSKEIRRGIEALKKRVEKHFGDADDPILSRDLVGKVLKECEAAYTKAYDRMAHINEVVYENSIELAWSKEDAVAMFARER